MANVDDEGVASLEPGWENLPTRSLRDLRTVLSVRMVRELNRAENEHEAIAYQHNAEAKNCRDLAQKVREELARRATAGDKEAA